MVLVNELDTCQLQLNISRDLSNKL